MKDFYNEIEVVHLLDPTDISTTDTWSKIVDCQNFEALMIIANIGVCTGATAAVYVTPTLQESATLLEAGFAAVGATDILGGFSKIDDVAEDSVSQVAGYIGAKRYVRVFMNVTGSLTNCPVAIDAILAKGRHMPPSAVAALVTTG